MAPRSAAARRRAALAALLDGEPEAPRIRGLSKQDRNKISLRLPHTFNSGYAQDVMVVADRIRGVASCKESPFLFAHLLHRPRLGGVGGQDQHRDGSEWLQRPAALRLHHLHRLPGPGLHLVFQLHRDDLPRQDQEQGLGALPGGAQPPRRVRRLDHREGQQHLHRAERSGLQRRREVHVPRQEPQGEECAAQRLHLPHRRPQDGGDGQHRDAHHRGRCGGPHRPPHPLHAGQESCPLHHQEDAGQKEGVPRELLGERQHRERPAGLQGGAESSAQGVKARRPAAPAREEAAGGQGPPRPVCFLSELPTLETCFG